MSDRLLKERNEALADLSVAAERVHVLEAALTAIKTCGSKGQAKRIAIQALGGSKQ